MGKRASALRTLALTECDKVERKLNLTRDRNNGTFAASHECKELVKQSHSTTLIANHLMQY